MQRSSLSSGRPFAPALSPCRHRCWRRSAGCAHARPRRRSDARYIARDVNTLYSLAVDRLETATSIKLAAQLFDEVERQHPYSIWARRAELMSAYSYYLGALLFGRRSSRRSASCRSIRATAMRAMPITSIAVDYYEQINDVTRDQKITGQALDALGELDPPLSRHADTPPTRGSRSISSTTISPARKWRSAVSTSAVAQWLASIIPLPRRDRQVSEHDARRPKRWSALVESNLELGVPAEAEKSAAVLGANYPGSKWYERAYDLMTKRAPRELKEKANRKG